MLATAQPSLSPGTFTAAAAPLTALLSSSLMVTLVGGPAEVSRVVDAAGSFATLVAISGLVEMTFLTLMLCHASTGRVVPLAVMLGVATLPWTVGLLGTEVLVGRAVAALGSLETSDARSILAMGIGEAMAPRMLGAWTSASLLVGLGLGLWMTGSGSEAQALSLDRPTRRGFGALVAFALAAIAVVGALEAHRLFELLTQLVQVPTTERVAFLGEAVDEVHRLRPIRAACLAVLVVLGVALVGWRARRGTRQAREWMGSVILLASVAALLVLDGHPLRSATKAARVAGLRPTAPPADFEALRTGQSATLHLPAAFATPRGLVPTTGPLLSWSASPEKLSQALSSSLGAAASPERSAGLTPEPVLPIQADARLSGAMLRRLVEASTRAGAHSIELVGQHPEAASPDTLARLEARLPLLAVLAARPGTLRLLLPSALSGPVSFSWRARLDGAALHLSPVAGGAPLTVPLHARPAEVPEVLAGAFVGVEVSERVSLKELNAAAEALALAGASPVVLLDAQSNQ